MLKKSQIYFVIYFLGTFLVVFVLLYALGLVPTSIKNNEGDSLKVLWDKAQQKAIDEQMQQGLATGENPVRIVIDKIGVDATVANPNTTNEATLDDYLLEGAIRYPGSGTIGFGNMLIIGHSTSYKVVKNQAFKTFNGLKDLKIGDIIKVTGPSKTYIYKVTSNTLVDKDKALIEFDNTKRMLTISTCNSIGSKSERYVVEADFVN